MFGTRKDYEEYEYDILFGLLCRKCQLSPWHTWLIILEDVYVDLCKAISLYSFTETLFFPKDGQFDIVDVYLKRFERLNMLTPECLDCVVNTHRCLHCKRECSVRCKLCKCICFCNKSSPDKRLYGSQTCRELASVYHDKGLCQYLRDCKLFHINDAMYINDEGEIQFANGSTSNGDP